MAGNRVVRPIVVRGARLALDQFTANPLMESLGVIVLDEFPDHVAQMARSPKMTNWFRHSYFMVFTNLSACGLQLGRNVGYAR